MTRSGSEWTSGIRGTVFDEVTGTPIEGAVVTARTVTGFLALSTLTDRSGRFFMPHEATGRESYDIAVSHIAYGSARRRLEAFPTDQLVVDVALAGR